MGMTARLFCMIIARSKHAPQLWNRMAQDKKVQDLFTEALRLHGDKQVAAAERLYREILQYDAGHAHSLHMLGRIVQEEGRLEEAETLVRKAIAQDSVIAVYHRTLGAILRGRKKFEESIESYKTSLRLKPHAAAALTLGEILHNMGRYEEAVQYYRQAVQLDPQNVTAISNITAILTGMGMFEKSRTYCEAILAREPEHPHALNNLAVACKAAGRMDEALAYARRAVAAAPDNAQIYSNLLLMMVYADSVSPQELAEMSRGFGRLIADKIPRRHHDHVDRDPDRKLRVGFVSPDFFNHAVNYFFEPLLTLRDREHFEFFGYSNVFRADEVTARLKTEFDHWRDIQFTSDEDVADVIQADGIDILIDLAGHTANNRLPVFARKPAPVQVTWLGYPATTGMAAMDYRITDAYAEPMGMTEELNTETLWRLPRIFCCYRPHENSPAVIDHPPFVDNGYITFGCFNNFAKVTDETLAAWAKIMADVPDARLLMEIGSLDEFRAAVEAKLRAAGLDLSRITLIPRAKENQFVLYNRVDIALDPFPCCGGTTSMDTLWMGVPFVTLAGAHFVSRMGVTILSNAGLPELIAQNVDEYVVKVVGLATERDRLRHIRHGLREKVMAMPLLDSDSFARDMQDGLRTMWKDWCGRKS